MTALYGVASDIHLHNWTAFAGPKVNGVNERLNILLRELEKVSQKVIDVGGHRLVITGDLFHVRGSITPSVINPTLTTFRKMIDKGLTEIVVLAGNHDLESKNSSSLTNACEILSQIPEIKVVSDTCIDETTLSLYVPWHDSCEDLMVTINNYMCHLEGNVAEYDLFIHAPVDDVLPNMPNHGIGPDDLKNLGFRYVFSGHYHNHKEVRADVFSVGALTHQTWGDSKSKAGYMIVGEDSIQHFESDAPKFEDYDATSSMTDEETLEICKGNYVRVKLSTATQSEVEEIRRQMRYEFQAKDCIIQSIATSKVVSRTSTASKSTSLRESVAEFIKAKSLTVKESDLTAECEDILSATVDV